jgi:hypothetical protein
MMLAHVAGMPFEEWLAPVAATGSGIALALRAAMHRLRQPSPEQAADEQCGIDGSQGRASPLDLPAR